MSTAPQPALRVVVDDREGRSDLAAALAARWPDVVVGRLPAGDVEIGPRVLVERKTVADLVLSIEDGRLLRQAWGLTRACEAPLLIVEGEDAIDAARLAPRALRGVVLSLLLGYRVPLYRTADVEETADVIAHVAAQEARRLGRLAAPRERTPGRMAMDVLASIPSVGDQRARRLLDAFGSVRAVAAASDDALLETPDIGPVTVRSLRRALGEAGCEAGGRPRGDGGAAADGPAGCDPTEGAAGRVREASPRWMSPSWAATAAAVHP